jgi:hypothetical protein
MLRIVSALEQIRARKASNFSMPKCDVCGNEYDKAFQVLIAGQTHTFDSFECAVQRLAPVCAHCNCRILGHGVEQGSQMFCCAHCAKQMLGATPLTDRA